MEVRWEFGNDATFVRRGSWTGRGGLEGGWVFDAEVSREIFRVSSELSGGIITWGGGNFIRGKHIIKPHLGAECYADLFDSVD